MIPIKVEPDRDVKDAKLFASYIEQYNKSYKDDLEISKMRFEHFQVNNKAIRSSNERIKYFMLSLNQYIWLYNWYINA